MMKIRKTHLKFLSKFIAKYFCISKVIFNLSLIIEKLLKK